MKRRSLLVSGLALLACLAVTSVSQAQQVRLRYAHVGAEGDIQSWAAWSAYQD